ncbi:NAD(+) synthase [Fulvivirga lutimaris]|uniref:NAD(+) synthase n=1 Tax=Fulvivirga lutimaris TaxID=1819566 RepID=UPI0012BD78BB|nr:NAD(+) synthase [Fulvivirga lutimaris]MTI39940.1 NAD(+) synthase [Fulvivirga lutimaris]
MSKTRIGGATLNQTPLDWTGNRFNILEAIRKAQEEKVEILCLPELSISGYGCEDNFLSDWVYEQALKSLLLIIPHCNDITVAIGLPYKHNDINYNVTCIVKDKTILGFYAKQNLALDGVHYEPRWFKKWPSEVVEQTKINGSTYDIGDIIIAHKDFTFGFEICEDAWRKVRPAIKLSQKGVDMILNPSASHFAFGKTIDRENLVVNSSSEFNCTYVYANLLGNEAGRMIYDGEILLAKKGKLIQRNDWLSFKNFNLIHSDVDITGSQEFDSPAEFPRDKNTEFVKASSLALFDYLRKSRSRGFVLSLSGGADSSSIAVMVSEMVRRGIKQLGAEAFLTKINRSDLIDKVVKEDPQIAAKLILNHLITCAYQGTINSSDDTFNSAKKLAEYIGATFYQWTIDDEVNSYTSKIENAIGRKLTWAKDDLALQNIQARSRSPIIWMLANINNALLLTTSNRSEGDVGYATMDGDTSGSISPIAAVDKYFIINWLKWAEKELDYSALNYVNNLTPTAELRPLENKQTDEDDLMPYSIIVEIEKEAIRNHKSPTEVFKALVERNLEEKEALRGHITKFFQMWSRNQWKRERIAPSFHLDDFNIDPRTWCRFPILSSGFEEELKELNNL